MKVLDHVPPTMHNFVANIFEILQLPSVPDGDFYRGAIDPNIYCSTVSGETWGKQGLYSFAAHFEGSPLADYDKHKIRAYLDISGVDDGVHIEWEVTHFTMSGCGLLKYWPGAEIALRGFTAQVYLLEPDSRTARQNLYEFVDDLVG